MRLFIETGKERSAFVSLVSGCLLAVVGLMGCERQDASQPVFPPDPPLTAVPLEGDGAYEVRMDLAISSLRRTLEPLVGDLHFSHYRLPNNSSWETVHRHYSQALSGDWTQVEGMQLQGRAYKAEAWRNADQAFLIAYIDDPTPGNPSKFSILLVATTDSP